MAALLVYAFLEDMAPFPDQLLNPTAYRLETFASRDDALAKARYVVSHSRVYNLAVWDLAAALDDAAVRDWIARHPDPTLAPASEAAAPPRPPG